MTHKRVYLDLQNKHINHDKLVGLNEPRQKSDIGYIHEGVL